MKEERNPQSTAALAVFLLFAAVLFGVTPAEASIPTGGVACEASASLQLHEYPLATSAFTPCRFIFAEGVSILDAEHAPRAFSLIPSETSRCERTYARNNPLKFVDPDGRQWADAIQVRKDREYALTSGGIAGLAAYDSGARQGAMVALGATAVAATSVLAAEFGPGLIAELSAAASPALVDVRRNYLAAVSALEKGIGEARAAGATAQEIAERFVPLRNEAKAIAREGQGVLSRTLVEGRNLLLYGNKLGPTAQQLFKKYGSWETVVQKILETNEKINRIVPASGEPT